MLNILSSLVLLAIASPTAVNALVPRNDSVSPHFDTVVDFVELIQEEIWPINQEIHENPELGWEEERAHKLLTDFLESQDGWVVTKSAYDISTAFVAVFEGEGDGPVVSFNAEYGELI